jgi:hypothetical protein
VVRELNKIKREGGAIDMKTPEGYGVNTNPYLLKKGILVNGVD